MFINKYNLTLKENIFLAKKQSIDLIYNSAKLEGCNVTFPETQTILEGINVGKVSLDDIQKILNLRDAWKYLLNSIEEPLNLDYIKKVHFIIGRNEALEWGVLRNGTVSITGVSYIPPVPDEKEIEETLILLMKSSTSDTYKAIRYFLWGCRQQFFWDCNKRTSTLIANKILISKGAGILSIPEKHLLKFNKLLSNFYETNDYEKISVFLYENCIHGLNIDRK
ncbi:MAG: hypothetical protein WC996_08730 [Peptostreptococcales bacterium]|jgi:Fic family protein